MTKYQKLLKSPKWKKKRLRILKRDGFKCTKCGNTKTLQVHHLYYIFPRMPWQYPDTALITLCNKCHKLEHQTSTIIVYRETVKKPRKASKKKK